MEVSRLTSVRNIGITTGMVTGGTAISSAHGHGYYRPHHGHGYYRPHHGHGYYRPHGYYGGGPGISCSALAAADIAAR